MRIFTTVVVISLCSSGVRGAAEKVFFGNLHSHTSYSDGSGTPSEAYTHARDVAKLDFLAITEHNHRLAESDAGDRRDGLLIATDHTLYNGDQSSSLMKTAARFNDSGKFVALFGQEFSSISKGNHMNVFEVSEVIDDATVPNGDFSKLITWLDSHKDSADKPAIVQMNHPSSKLRQQGIEYGADDFGNAQEWIEKIGAHAATIEILNGPALTPVEGKRSDADTERDFIYYLNQGFKLAPTGDQDNHYRTWGSITDTRTAIIAESLDKDAILEGLRARHVYATEDKNLRIIFHVNGHLCGDEIGGVAQGSALSIEYLISDDDEPTASYEIEVLSGKVGGQGASLIATVHSEGDNADPKTIEDVTYGGGPEFIFFKIIQTGEHGVPDRAWTAPVFLSSGAAEPVPGPGSTPTAAVFIASKKQGIYHISEDCRSVKAIRAENRITGEEARKGRSLHVGCPVK